MSEEDDAKYFQLRKEGRTYLSKVFTQGAISPERRRLAYAVFEGTERAVIGEIECALCLRLTGKDPGHGARYPGRQSCQASHLANFQIPCWGLVSRI